jgi:hypothetical protein
MTPKITGSRGLLLIRCNLALDAVPAQLKMRFGCGLPSLPYKIRPSEW